VFGSSEFRQFGPRRSAGYWLWPQLEQPSREAIDAGESSIDHLIAGLV
jgi:hypothetical protein